MKRRFESAKYDFFMERDRFSCKSQLDVQNELDYLRAWFDFFILSTHKETSDSGGDADCKLLEDKLKKLKLEFEKLAFKKGCEVSTLLQEYGFAWSEFKCIESRFTDKLMRRDEEIKQANKNILSLVTIQEQLESSNHEKDKIISGLMAKVAELEDKVSKNYKEERPVVKTPLRRSPRLNPRKQ
ncbi:PREDICTED: uncharacterized protein LOC104702322 isoform X2 [Camelina sativa]|uniref:Uncharacterized protein LOC104702322 isoform X2 n=1 Tax=Camelina sativa TaxID=90675 RepID=A0ABM0SUV8_CAMSA|nr:PREDICTED: uncharacterized protein LOC104702322 isoform X2 [Camelina sativa]